MPVLPSQSLPVKDHSCFELGIFSFIDVKIKGTELWLKPMFGSLLQTFTRVVTDLQTRSWCLEESIPHFGIYLQEALNLLVASSFPKPIPAR